jgi:hypothetical protein
MAESTCLTPFNVVSNFYLQESIVVSHHILEFSAGVAVGATMRRTVVDQAVMS